MCCSINQTGILFCILYILPIKPINNSHEKLRIIILKTKKKKLINVDFTLRSKFLFYVFSPLFSKIQEKSKNDLIQNDPKQ